jgi:hypothetical protein
VRAEPTQADVSALIHGVVVRWENRGGNIEHMLIRELTPVFESVNGRAASVDAVIERVRSYAEDRSYHAKTRNNTVSSWRIASDLLSILDAGEGNGGG